MGGSSGGSVSMCVSANEPSYLNGSPPPPETAHSAAHAQSEIMGAERVGGEPLRFLTSQSVLFSVSSAARVTPPLVRPLFILHIPAATTTERRARAAAHVLLREEKNIVAFVFLQLRGKNT